MITVDKAIGIGLGLGLTFLSISGLKCVNGQEQFNSSESKKCPKSNKCSKVNMNLCLSSFGIAGGLMVYKNTF
jgi:hypothetical protein